MRQPLLATSLIRACEAAMRALSSPSHAAIWLHLGALAQHAQAVGLIDDGLSLCASLDALARLHPKLSDLPSFACDMHEDDVQAISAHWHAVSLPVDSAALWYGYPLGDLYQALSTEARQARALCQTPYWVSELLLHVAYDRARESSEDPRVIDPACGTGHLLIESLMHKLSHERDVARALGRIAGIDIDPYAAMVARYRLLVLAWAQMQHRTDRAALVALPLHVASGNSLLLDDEPLLARGSYHVVLANPPYIVPKDAGDRDAIRTRYREVCLGRYSLALPFTVLMTELTVEGGYIAQLTTNAWMKREYGAPFIERFLSRYELVWIINSSGAYIPGHGTPTCILVHRNLPPSGKPALTVLSKRGEPSTPADPSKGVVWSAIRNAVYAQESSERFERRSALTQLEEITKAAPNLAPPSVRKQLELAFGEAV